MYETAQFELEGFHADTRESEAYTRLSEDCRLLYEARIASEARYRLFRTLLDCSNDMIQVVDPETGYFLDVNETCCRTLGRTRDEMLALRIVDVDPTIDATAFARSIVTLRSTGTLLREGVRIRKDGTTLPVDVSVSLVRLDREYAVSIVRDISERRRLELERTIQISALNAAADPVVITDREGTIVWVNQAFSTSTGYSHDDAIGRNPRTLLRSGHQNSAFYQNMWDTVLDGRVWKGELINRRKDGTVYPEAQTVTPVRSTGGEITHFIAVKRDLTNEKRLQAQLLQSQKMESVGRLAGGIAHDFNNLLLVMNGWTEIAIADSPKDSTIRPALEEVLGAGVAAAGLTRHLLAFSRQQIVAPSVFGVNDLISNIEKMLRRLVGEDITVSTKTDPAAGRIKMDRGQLEQVLMNLVVNSRDAMPVGGKLTIETANEIVATDAIRTSQRVRRGEYVTVTVTDSGCGMSDAVIKHIFEPFFTTKQVGKGTGLGLATSFGIVAQAGGAIDVTSEPGAGTTMKIMIPRSIELPIMARPRPLSVQRGVETILLVEDEPAARRVTSKMLESRGYRVLTAATGDDALKKLNAMSDPVHLLMTDVVLAGGMSGTQLADRVRALRPGLKVLFVSGYTADVTILHGLIEDAHVLVQKPFSLDVLATALQNVLSGPGAA